MSDIIERTLKARADLDKLKNLVDISFSKLCQLCEWNPKDDMPTVENEYQDAADEVEINEVTLCSEKPISECKDLIHVPQPALQIDRLAEHTQTCRIILKKIAQLTHPDKINRFDYRTKAKLGEIFHRAKIEFEFLDLPALAFSFVHVRIIRGEHAKIDPKLLELVEQDYVQTIHTFNYIVGLPFIPAVNALVGGNTPLAKTLFEEFIQHRREKRA